MRFADRNFWRDHEGNTYIYFSIETIMRSLNCAHGKTENLLALLRIIACWIAGGRGLESLLGYTRSHLPARCDPEFRYTGTPIFSVARAPVFGVQ